jgi:histidine ammonia-lyase
MEILAGSPYISISDLILVSRRKAKVGLNPDALKKVKISRSIVEKAVLEKRVVYGITTGFGKLAETFIPFDKNQELQKNLLLSHAVGVGEPLPEEVVRGMLFLRLHSLAKGFSGVRPAVLDYLVRFLNENCLPVVPSQGSVGSSGDLAPLAHLALPLIGYGEVLLNSRMLRAADALKELGLGPLTLEAKEGLGLINGTQAMTTIGALSVHDAENLFNASLSAAAMTLEATLSAESFLFKKIHQIRPHEGQLYAAERMRQLVEGSQLIESHKNSLHKIQDAYSIRCIPQVHGAVLDALKYVKQVLEVEINSVTDNPLVFPEEEAILSGGNFHGHPVALPLDFLKIALASLSNISERRIERLVNPALSCGLPAFLTKYSGICSGMMILQYTAASLVSENKGLSSPASVDSIPTSANQEDYNSMGTTAARQLAKIVSNSFQVVGIEFLCAAQGLEFRRPLKFGVGVEKAFQKIREVVPPLEQDRLIKLDLEKIVELVQSGKLSGR